MRRLLLAAALLLSPLAASALNCGTTVTIAQAGGATYNNVTNAVGGIPLTLTGDYCIYFLDNAVYNEHVSIAGINTGNFRIYIGTVTPTVGGRPTISNGGGPGVFEIYNASVTFEGINLVPTGSVQYGLVAAGGYISISSVNINPGAGMTGASVTIASYTTVNHVVANGSTGNGIQIYGPWGNNVVSNSTFTNNGSADLFISGSDSNTVVNCKFENGNGVGGAINGSSEANLISFTTISVIGTAFSGLNVLAALNTISNSYLQGGTGAVGAGLLINGTAANQNTVSNSVIVGRSQAAALYSFGSNRLKVSNSFVHSYASYGVFLDSGTSGATIINSTLTAFGGAAPALFGNQSSSVNVVDSYISNSNGASFELVAASSYSVYNSTIASNNGSWPAAILIGADNNLIRASVVQNPLNNAMDLRAGSDSNTLLNDLLFANTSLTNSLYVTASASNSVVGSDLQNPNGSGVAFTLASNGNSISGSRVTASGGADPALNFTTGSSSNTISDSTFSNPTGPAAKVYGASNNNTFLRSTFTCASVALDLSVSNMFVASNVYVQSTGNLGYSDDSASYANTIALSTIVAQAAAASIAGSFTVLTNSAFIGVGAGAVSFFNAANNNTISSCTLTNNNGANPALHFNGPSVVSNTISNSFVSNGTGDAVRFTGNSRFNSIAYSTAVSLGSQRGVNMVGSSNTITGSYLGSATGRALFIGAGSNWNSVLRSSIVAVGDIGAFVQGASSASFTDSYIQGSTAAAVSASTMTVFVRDVFVAKDPAGQALTLSAGGASVANVGLVLTSSTLQGGPNGEGLDFQPVQLGEMVLSSLTFTGSARGIRVSTQNGVIIDLSSFTFRNMAAGATAYHFLGGVVVATISGVSFEDATIGANVNASALDPTSRITMRNFTGLRFGPDFENDPLDVVEWPGMQAYPGCAATRNVAAGGSSPYTTIQAAVNALPNPVNGEACVVIEDFSTYAEQVTVEGFNVANGSITIRSRLDQAAPRPRVVPPPASTAAFVIKNASVTLAGMEVSVNQSMPYGIRVSSGWVHISSVVAHSDFSPGVTGAVLSFSGAPYANVVYSSVTTSVPATSAMELNGSSGAYIARSTFSAANGFAVYMAGSSTNTLYAIRAEAADNTLTLVTGARFNVISFSNILHTGNNRAVFIGDADSNTITWSYISAPNGSAVYGQNGGNSNNITFSTMTANAAVVNISGLSSTTISDSYLGGANTAALLFLSNSYWNTVRRSTITNNNLVNATVFFYSGASSNTLSNSFVSNPNGGTLVLGASASNNTVSGSSLAAGGTAILLESASDNFFSGNYAYAGSSDAVRMDPGAVRNVIVGSTFTAGNVGSGLRLGGASSNTFNASFFYGGAGTARAVTMDSGAHDNTIAGSTLTATSGQGLFVQNSGSNTVTRSNIRSYSPGPKSIDMSNVVGFTVSYSTFNSFVGTSVTSSTFHRVWAYADNNEVFNLNSSSNVTISFSTFTSNSLSNRALNLFVGWGHAITDSYFSNTLGGQCSVWGTASFMTIANSTFSTNSIGSNALFISNSSSNTFTRVSTLGVFGGTELGSNSNWNSFSQSSFTAVNGHGFRVQNSTGTQVAGSYLAGTLGFDLFTNTFKSTLFGSVVYGSATTNAAVRLGSSQDVDIASNTIYGMADGVVESAMYGVTHIVGNNVSARESGIELNVNSGGSEVWVSSNVINPSGNGGAADMLGIYVNGVNTVANIQNNSVYMRQSAAIGGALYGIKVAGSTGVLLLHNRVNLPNTYGGAGGNYLRALDFGTSSLSFLHNDVNLACQTGCNPFEAKVAQLDAAGGTLDLRYNNFAANLRDLGANATYMFFLAGGVGSLQSDYNLFFSSTGPSYFNGNGSYAVGLSSWQFYTNRDVNSSAGEPYFADTKPGTEDFHVKSAGGRCANPPTCSPLVNDVVTSFSLDRADQSDPYGDEPAPNGFAANLGSTGGTAEASLTPPQPCGVFRTVCRAGTCGSTSIQGAINSLPRTLPGYACVAIRDAGPYNESLQIASFTMAGSSIAVYADTAFTTYTYLTPALVSGLAVLDVRSASVTVSGLQLRLPAAGGTVPHGVYVSSPNVRLRDITVYDDANRIMSAAIALTSHTSLSGSSVTINGNNVQVLTASGSYITVERANLVNTSFGAGMTPYFDIHSATGVTLSDLRVVSSFSNPAAELAFINGLDVLRATFTTSGGYALGLSTVSDAVISQMNLTGSAALTVNSVSTNVVVDRAIITASPTAPTVGVLLAGSNLALSNSTLDENAGGGSLLVVTGGQVALSTLSVSNAVGGIAGHLFNASSVTVTRATFTATSAVGLKVEGGYNHSIFDSTATSSGSYGLLFINTTGHSVRRGAMRATFNGVGSAALGFDNATFVNVAYARIDSYNDSYGAAFNSGSQFNVIDNSTITARGSGSRGVSLNASSSNTVAGSVIVSTGNTGVDVGGSAQAFNLTASTVSTHASGGIAMRVTNSANASITGSYLSGSRGYALYVVNGADGTKLYNSTAVTGSPTQEALVVDNAASFDARDSLILSTGGYHAVTVQNGAAGAVFDRCSVQRLGGVGYALRFTTIIGPNVFKNGYIVSTSSGADLNGTSDAVLGSTVVAAAVGVHLAASAEAVAGSYVAASTAVVVDSGGVRVSSSHLVGTASGAAAAWFAFGSNFTLEASTVAGPPNGVGALLGGPGVPGGLIQLSTNTFKSGPQTLARASNLGASTNLWISSNTFYPTVGASTSTYGLLIQGLGLGATVQYNDFRLRTPGAMGAANIAYGLHAFGVTGLRVANNRYNAADVATSGGVTPFFIGSSPRLTFVYNDVASEQKNNTSAYLLNLENSPEAYVTGNILVSAQSGANTPVTVNVADSASGSSLRMDYNDLYPIDANNRVGRWHISGIAFNMAAWQSNSGQDANSISADPLWASTATEDFHPLSAGGRYSVALATFTFDATTSPTIDRGDPLAPRLGETFPGSGRVNMGSYGQTAEASRPAPPAGCSYEIPVGIGGYASIAVALTQVDSSLTNDPCIVIRKAPATHFENDITVGGFTMNGHRLTIMGEPGVTTTLDVGGAVNPFAFQVNNDSVTIRNLTIAASAPVSNGIRSNGTDFAVTSVTFLNASNITSTALSVTTRAAVSYSSGAATLVGLQVSGTAATVSYSTFAATGAGSGMRVDAGSATVIDHSYAWALNGTGVSLAASLYTQVLGSTFTSATGLAALRVAASSQSVVTASVLSNAAGPALRVDNQSWGNMFARSILTGGTATEAAVLIMNASSNTITESAVTQQSSSNTFAIRGVPSKLNTLSAMTITAPTSNDVIGIDEASSTTLHSLWVEAATGRAVHMESANFTVIDLSTITAGAGPGAYAVLSGNSSWGRVSRSYLNGTAGKTALNLGNQSNRWTVDTSTLQSTNVAATALFLDNSSYTLVSRSFVLHTAGGGRAINTNLASAPIVDLSTVVSVGAEAILVNNTRNLLVHGSYVEGATGMNITGGSALDTVVSKSMLAAVGGAQPALYLQNSAAGLSVSSSVILGGPGGHGLKVDSQVNRPIFIATNTILSGPDIGIWITTQNAGATVFIASNTVELTINPVSDTAGILLEGLRTGATLYNNSVYMRTNGDANARAVRGIALRESENVHLDRNRVSIPGLLEGGSAYAVLLTSSPRVMLRGNDMNIRTSAGFPLSEAVILDVRASSQVWAFDNVISASMTVSGTSASFRIDGFSTASSTADYNNYFSSNSRNTRLDNSGAQEFPWGANGIDSHATSFNPRWASDLPGAEDFHPLSNNGRWIPSLASFQNDNFTAGTIDRGSDNIAGAVGDEAAPNGSRRNMGSYGGTAEASRTPPAPTSPAIAAVSNSFISVSYTASGSPSHAVVASTAPDFSGQTTTALGVGGTSPLSPSPLLPNVTYYLQAHAIWGDYTSSDTLVLSTCTRANTLLQATPNFVFVGITSATPGFQTNGNPLGITTYTVAFSTDSFFPNANAGNVVFSTVANNVLYYSTGTGLAPNTTYFAFASALNHNGARTTWATLGSTATRAAAPTPAGYGAAGDTYVQAYWNANGNPLSISSYVVLVSTDSGFLGGAALDVLYTTAPAAGPMATLGGLQPATTYYTRVQAKNGDGALTAAAFLGQFITLPLSINPPALNAVAQVNLTSITANWASLTQGATGYTLAASTESINPPLAIWASSTTSNSASTATVFAPALQPNTTYFLFVRSNGLNGVSAWAQFPATATLPAPPAGPGSITDLFESSFTITWNAAGNPLGMTTYTVVASTASDFNAGASSVTYSTNPFSGPTFTLTGLAPYQFWYVQARAIGMDSARSSFTFLGSTQTTSLTLPAPVAVGFTGVSATSATATWGLVSGATGYTLVAASTTINPPISLLAVSSVATTTGSVYGLSINTSYYLLVRAEGPGGFSPYTVMASSSTDPVSPSSATPSFSAETTSGFDYAWTTNGNPLSRTTYTVTVSTTALFPNSSSGNQTIRQVPSAPAASQTFAGLGANTTYYAFAQALSDAGSRIGLAMGSTATLANAPTPGAPSIFKTGTSSVTLQWNLNGNPVVTTYTVVASTASDFNAFATSVTFSTASVSGSAVVSGLAFGTTWYFQVRAQNHRGAVTAYANLGSTYTFLSSLIPLVIDNQSGDDAWRGDFLTLPVYSIQFADGSGTQLDYAEVSVSSSPGGAGDLVPYTLALSGINADSYGLGLTLPSAAFNGMIEGTTGYVTVRVWNHVPSSATLVDAFYVRKDTTAPTFVNGEAGGDSVIQSTGGRAYNLTVRDVVSGLGAFQYSVSATALAGDQAVLPWTDIATLNGATDYTTPWTVNFAGLRDGATNYVSVRAWDLAGTTRTLVDAFRILKDTTGPTISISTPNVTTTFVSSVPAVSGVQSSPFGVSGASVAFQQVSNSQYWNGVGFLNATPFWFDAPGGSTYTLTAPNVGFTAGFAYRIIARGKSAQNVFSTRFATAAFTFDNAVPTVAVTSPTASAVVASIPQLSGTAADVGAGVASTEVRLLRLSDGKWWNWVTETFGASPVSSVTAGSALWSVTPSAALQANMLSGASYYIAVRANDNTLPPNSGDFFAAGSTFTFNDPTPPAAIADLAAVNGTTPGDISLTWHAQGAHGAFGTTLSGQYAIFASTDNLATPSTAAATAIISTANVAAGAFQGYIGGNGTLTPGVTYFIWVAMSNLDGNWSAFSNQASTTACPAPSNSITGHVVNASTQGITAVRIDAYDSTGVLAATAFTLADGSGTYSVNGLVAGNYKIEASWTANGITSSAWIDGIAMGSFNIDFSLDINYALATLTGTLGALSSSGQAGLGIAGAGYRPSAAGSRIELFQGGREVARVSPDPTGRWTIGHLLPGGYSVRAYTGLGYTDFQDVDLMEGEIRTVGFVFNPLPDATVFAFPNPARTSTTIRFETALTPLEAQIAIFDLKGALVREVPGSQISATATPGVYHYVWDLTNDRGSGVASGVYLFMVKVKGGSENQLVKVVKKLAVVR